MREIPPATQANNSQNPRLLQQIPTHELETIMMEDLAWLILGVIIVKLVINRFHGTRNLPPGPFPFPIIGNAHKLASNSRHVDLTKLEKQCGKVFRLYLGSKLVVVVSSENALKEVLVTKPAQIIWRTSEYLHYRNSLNGEGNRTSRLFSGMEVSSQGCFLCTRNIQ